MISGQAPLPTGPKPRATETRGSMDFAPASAARRSRPVLAELWCAERAASAAELRALQAQDGGLEALEEGPEGQTRKGFVTSVFLSFLLPEANLKVGGWSPAALALVHGHVGLPMCGARARRGGWPTGSCEEGTWPGT